MKYLLLTISFSLILLSGCSTVVVDDEAVANQPAPAAGSESTQAATTPHSPAGTDTQHYGQFSTETLYSLIVAELAAGRRQYDITLNNYIKEANSTGDLGIITRAARMAQYFRKHDQTIAMAKQWLAQRPDNIEANAIIATAYIEKRQPLQALNYAEHILPRLSPSNPEANKSAAITETIANYSRSADTLTKETLITRYQGLVQRYPHFVAIKVGLSVLYESQQDTAAAYSVIKQAIAQNRDYLPAVIQEIRLLQASQQNELAIEKIQVLLDKQPDNNRLRLLYARMLTQTDINAAYEEFTRLSEQSPQHLDIQFSRALIAIEIKKTDEAKQILDNLRQRNYRPDTVNFYLGSLAELEKDYDSALAHYLAVGAGEDYIPSHSRAARIMAEKGNIREAQAHFEQLRARSPNRRPELYAAEAEVLAISEQLESAIDILTQAISEYPDDINLRYSRSSYYEQTNQLALMESDLRHALSIEPESASTLNALGYFLTSRTDRHEEAYVLIQKALSLKPNDPAIMDSMGWVLFNLGRNEEAIEYLRKAFELFPDPEVAAHLGEALWVTGNKQEARTIWNNNLKDNPNDSRIIDTMERLKVTPN